MRTLTFTGSSSASSGAAAAAAAAAAPPASSPPPLTRLWVTVINLGGHRGEPRKYLTTIPIPYTTTEEHLGTSTVAV